MKNNPEKNMLIAFLLNIIFTIIEIIGGILTNSVSIISDAIHDLGDSISIGIAVILERISHKKPNERYTYGYVRFSIIGAIINLLILLIGTIIMLYTAIPRLFNPQEVNHEGMLVLAILGIFINLIGVLKTKKGKSINEKAISLHLLEDVLGWIMVFIAGIMIEVFGLYIIDPILSIIISIFILINVIKNIIKINEILLEKVPKGIKIDEIKDTIEKKYDIEEMHHIHVWTLDGNKNFLTAHIKVSSEFDFKNLDNTMKKMKHELEHFNINHSTIEIEIKECIDKECKNEVDLNQNHHHHH